MNSLSRFFTTFFHPHLFPELTKKEFKPWIPITDPGSIFRLNKTAEESNELACVAVRCVIQGLNEIDPSSGRVNRHRLEDEIADVLAQIDLTIERFNLDQDKIQQRRLKKIEFMKLWERDYARQS